MCKENATKRGIIYIRKSVQGEELSPQAQLRWAVKEAERLGVYVDASESQLGEMLKARASHQGDIYVDIGISGAEMQRPGFDAFRKRATEDEAVSHLFVQMRDRLARPEDPVDGIGIENELRHAGKTLVLSGKELAPLARGEVNIGDLVTAAIDYHSAGQDLKKLAERIVGCQRNLAEGGYWTGGRPPYGFVRVLVGPDGKEIRKLKEGERVRQRGCHVRIKPGDQEKIETWLRIIEMHVKNGWGIKRIANELNRQGIPSPDAGRVRHDRYGNAHEVSGKWAPNTVGSLLRNPAIAGCLTWGTRSEGAHRRIGEDGPRILVESDYAESGRPRVIRNPQELRVTKSMGYDPILAPEAFKELQESLEARGKSQRGTTRSSDPYRYLFAGRIFDVSPDCGWPMYGRKRGKVLKYVCGQYMATAGDACEHNTIAVEWVSTTVLEAVRQAVLMGERRLELENRIRAIAEASASKRDEDDRLDRVTAELTGLEAQVDQAKRNLALAGDEKTFAAVQEVFRDLSARLEEKRREVESLRQEVVEEPDFPVEQRVERAMALLDDLDKLDEHAHGPEFKRLIEVLDVRVWPEFKKVRQGKRLLNKFATGLITTGDAPWPIEPYSGPRNGSAGRTKADTKNREPAGPEGPTGSKSYNKVHRGDWI